MKISLTSILFAALIRRKHDIFHLEILRAEIYFSCLHKIIRERTCADTYSFLNTATYRIISVRYLIIEKPQTIQPSSGNTWHISGWRWPSTCRPRTPRTWSEQLLGPGPVKVFSGNENGRSISFGGCSCRAYRRQARSVSEFSNIFLTKNSCSRFVENALNKPNARLK